MLFSIRSFTCLHYICLSLSLICFICLIPSPAHSQTNLTNSKPASDSIKLLVASWCVRCKDMEELLKEQRVQYLRMDVEKDPEAKELYEAVGGGGVPILIVGNKLLRGFNHSAVLELLKSHQP